MSGGCLQAVVPVLHHPEPQGPAPRRGLPRPGPTTAVCARGLRLRLPAEVVVLLPVVTRPGSAEVWCWWWILPSRVPRIASIVNDLPPPPAEPGLSPGTPAPCPPLPPVTPAAAAAAAASIGLSCPNPGWSW